VGTAYTATVSLSANTGYTFKDMPAPFTHDGGIDGTPGFDIDVTDSTKGTVTIKFAETAKRPITGSYDLIQCFMYPLIGTTPAAAADLTVPPQLPFTGTQIIWASADSLFKEGVSYTATITLEPESGWEFDPAIAFTYKGGTVGVPEIKPDGTVEVTVSFAPLTLITVTGTDLTLVIPAPVTGASGIGSVNAAEYTGTVTWEKTAGGAYTAPFAAETAYTATVNLQVRTGYTFTGIGAGSFTHNKGTPSFAIETSDSTKGVVTIPFAATAKHTISGTLDLTSYFTAPAAGGTPVTALTGSNFTGTVSWNPNDLTFDEFKPYTATVTLTPDTGYEFAPNIGFTHSGGTVGSKSDAGGGKVAVPVNFAALKTQVSQKALDSYIPVPVAGATGTSYFNAPQYSGNVTWKKTADNSAHSGPFAADTAYTAAVTLTAHAGYTFKGLANNAFTYTGVTPAFVSNTETSYEVKLDFPVTPKILISGPIDLTLYLPAPVVGAQPAASLAVPAGSPFTGGAVTWFIGQSSVSPPTFGTAAYTAKVPLSASAGYTFKDSTGTVSFTHSKSKSGGTSFAIDTSDSTKGTVTINFEKPALAPVTILNLQPYVPKPVTGGTPVPSFSTAQYSATIAWNPAPGASFSPETAYTATLALTASPGYSFPPNFSHAGATGIDHSQLSSNKVTLTFAATGKTPATMITEVLLHNYIPNPVVGERKVTHFDAPGYSGDIVWGNIGSGGNGDFFVAGGIYNATIMLRPLPGYAFDPAPFNSNANAVYGPSSLTYKSVFNGNLPAQLDVEFRFNYSLETGEVLVFGSTDTTANSARKLMAARKSDSSLEIDLPAGSETIPPGSTFTAGANSPAAVVINGNNRTLRLQSGSTGSIITVGNGVTLTLRDVTLQGHDTNTAALVTVLSGGTLNLEYVVIKDNTNTATSDGGGALVQGGGSLTMKGGTVTGNKANKGGGVAVQGNGQLNINNNTTISLNVARTSGGGIYAAGPNGNTVIISNTSIRENIAESYYGGGIYAFGTSVTMANSSVTENRSPGSSGGGVYFLADSSSDRTFTMTGGRILNNTANNMGGGVDVMGSASFKAIFSMGSGEIASNTAHTGRGVGVYLGPNATFTIGPTAKLAQNQTVCIGENSSRINITGTLLYNPAANTESLNSSITNGDQVLLGSISGNYQKFLYKGQTGKFDSTGKFLGP
jgi:hypothetical protein